MQFCKHVFPEFTIDDMLILCSTAAVEMGYFTNYEFQWHNIMALKFISTSFHLFCSLNISTSLSRSLSVRVSFLSFTMCIMASRLFCESMFLEFVHMSFIRLKDLSTDCVDSKLFYCLKSKLINLLLFPSFPNSHHLCANFPNSKGPCPSYKWVGKSLDFKYIKTYIESSDMTTTYEVSYRIVSKVTVLWAKFMICIVLWGRRIVTPIFREV